MEEKSFIIKNENEMNAVAVKILLVSAVVAFPMLFILNYLKIFNISWSMLGIFTVLSIVLSAIPFILHKAKIKSVWIKYFTIIISTAIVGMLASCKGIGVHIMYIFPVVMSCLYFDRKLTWTAFGFGIPSLLISQYYIVVVRDVDKYPGGMNAYIALAAGYIVEFLVLSLIFSMLARRTRSLLNSLMGSEDQAVILKKLKAVMARSTEASGVLADSLQQLTVTMEETAAANETIVKNTMNAADGSDKNLKYIENTMATVDKISDNLSEISKQSSEMAEISSKTYTSAQQSVNAITKAVESMGEVEESSAKSRDLINRLANTLEQIDRIIDIIKNMTKQTNMLAINAAIESAGAGEHGRGFAVVAEQVRRLSEQSGSSVNEISNLISNIKNDTESAIESIDYGTDITKRGTEDVRNAGRVFEELKQLQDQSYKKAQEIASSSSKINNYGNDIKNIIVNIKELTGELQGELQSIAGSTQHQSAAMQELSASFDVLDKIAEDLLALSKSTEL